MFGERKWILVVAVLAIVAIVASGLTIAISADLDARSKDTNRIANEKEMAVSLIRLSSSLQTNLSHIEMLTLNAASELRGQALGGASARGVMTSLLSSDKNIVNALTTDAKGVVLAIEPSVYSGFEGTDVSSDIRVADLLYAGRSFMSPLATMYQGYEGVVICAPILDSQNKISGMLSVMFRPDKVLENITSELGMGPGMKMNGMVLQKDGVILYDVDVSQVGKNTFTDPLFQNFTEIKAVASRMVNETCGNARYTFYQPGVTNPVTKEVAWTTVSCLGVDWTVAVIDQYPTA
jgi:hypothetical protein